MSVHALLRMNLGIETHFWPIMLPETQDLELLPSSRSRCISWLPPNSVAGETDVRVSCLSCSHLSIGKNKGGEMEEGGGWDAQSQSHSKAYSTNKPHAHTASVQTCLQPRCSPCASPKVWIWPCTLHGMLNTHQLITCQFDLWQFLIE